MSKLLMYYNYFPAPVTYLGLAAGGYFLLLFILAFGPEESSFYWATVSAALIIHNLFCCVMLGSSLENLKNESI